MAKKALSKRSPQKRSVQREEEQRIQEIIVSLKTGNDVLWQYMLEKTQKIAAKFCKKYYWIDGEDLTHNVLMNHKQKIFDRYNIGDKSNTSFSKYSYHAIYRAAQDELRKEDPLGMKIPQKKKHLPGGKYPEWHRLGDMGFETYDFDSDGRRPVHSADDLIDEDDDFESSVPVDHPDYLTAAERDWRGATIQQSRDTLDLIRSRQIKRSKRSNRDAVQKAVQHFPAKKLATKKLGFKRMSLSTWIKTQAIPKQMELFA